MQHYSEISVPRHVSGPSIKMSDLNDQLEAIKAKNRRYKPAFTQRCYEDEEEEGAQASSYLARAPRAFRLGEEEFEAGMLFCIELFFENRDFLSFKI